MDFKAERYKLVDKLVSWGYLKSPEVIEALRKVQRHRFLPYESLSRAYVDSPQPIGYDQTISAPHMVAIMSELIDARKDSKILEVGTGSGYQAAILAELACDGEVTTVERVPELVKHAKTVLYDLGYENVTVLMSDGTVGFEDGRGYDRIMVTAAAPAIPSDLVDQLVDGGKLLIPVGGRWSQSLVEVNKTGEGVSETDRGGCVFVPLIGEKGWSN